MADAPEIPRDRDPLPPPPPPMPGLFHSETEVPFFGEGRWRRRLMRKVRSLLPHSPVPAGASVEFTIAFEEPDEDGWIVARILKVPGALSKGRTRREARRNAIDALRFVLTMDHESTGERSKVDLERLRFVAGPD